MRKKLKVFDECMMMKRKFNKAKHAKAHCQAENMINLIKQHINCIDQQHIENIDKN